MQLKEILRIFLARNLRIESERTRGLYRGVVDAFEKFLERPADTDDFSDERLVEFIQHRRTTCSPHTVDREVSRLMTLWKFASRLGYCSWPTMQLKRRKPPIPEAWLEHEIRALFAAAANVQGQIKGCKGADFCLSLLGLFWDTGERLFPVIDLDRTDVGICELTVRFRGRKSGAADRIRQISKFTARDLERLLSQHAHAKVFVGAHRTLLYYHLEKLLIAAGLPTDHRSKFHRLRRSHASHLHRAGGNATDSLDHSSDAITRASYLDPRVAREPSVIQRLFNPRRKWWQFWL